jgi:hypothetical protein
VNVRGVASRVREYVGLPLGKDLRDIWCARQRYELSAHCASASRSRADVYAPDLLVFRDRLPVVDEQVLERVRHRKLHLGLAHALVLPRTASAPLRPPRAHARTSSRPRFVPRVAAFAPRAVLAPAALALATAFAFAAPPAALVAGFALEAASR